MKWEEQWQRAVKDQVLTKREWQVLSLRAGIGGEPLTWDEVGYAIGDPTLPYGSPGVSVSGERARQLASRALNTIEDHGLAELHFMLHGACFGRYRMKAKG